MEIPENIPNSVRSKILIDALPHIQRYNGKIVVVKYGGNAMTNEALKQAVMSDIVLLSLVGIKVVLVHGGGPEINDMLRRLNIESKFIGGLRYTDKETVDVVKMVLAGKVNKELVALLAEHQGSAVGLCGIDGQMLMAEKVESEQDLGYVGDIVNVNTKPILDALNGGYVPVIATVASSKSGQTYNVNADTAAARIAAELKAENLILMTDIAGQGRPLHADALCERQRGALLKAAGHHLRRHDPQDRLLRGGGAPGRAQDRYHRRPDPPLHPHRAAVQRGHRHPVQVRCKCIDLFIN